ncbi:RICIN domain-containing protein, partial [Vibrio splendidus]|uniref:RICIN domain-containing protein n=1 Tax=Vibrio splendidus TaxID=29497 RepID=UPI003D115B63
ITPPSGSTSLQFIHSNKCLDVKNGATWNGSTYQQWGCNTSNTNQRFTFTPLSDGAYLPDGDKSQFNMDEEMFIILDTEDHSWRSEAGIIASDADLADNSKNKMYVDWIRVYKPVGDSDNNGITPPSGSTSLQFIHSNKCLDVKNGATWNGSTYQQWGCNTSNTNQRFTFTPLSDGAYLLQSDESQLCVELKPDSSQWQDGATIQQYICNAAEENQLWTLFDKGSDSFELRNKRTGKCLELANNQTSNGGQIVQSSCDGGNNQRLTFK